MIAYQKITTTIEGEVLYMWLGYEMLDRKRRVIKIMGRDATMPIRCTGDKMEEESVTPVLFNQLLKMYE